MFFLSPKIYIGVCEVLISKFKPNLQSYFQLLLSLIAANLVTTSRRLSLSCSQAAVGVNDKWSHTFTPRDLTFRAQVLSKFSGTCVTSLDVGF